MGRLIALLGFLLFAVPAWAQPQCSPQTTCASPYYNLVNVLGLTNQGNETIAGTLGVTGVSTLTGGTKTNSLDSIGATLTIGATSPTAINIGNSGSTTTLLGTVIGPAGGLITVSNTYTSAGAIATTDSYSLINSASSLAMTLANGSVNGHSITINNYGVGTATVTLKLQGSTQAVPLASGSVLNLFWNTSLTTYLLAS